MSPLQRNKRTIIALVLLALAVGAFTAVMVHGGIIGPLGIAVGAFLIIGAICLLLRGFAELSWSVGTILALLVELYVFWAVVSSLRSGNGPTAIVALVVMVLFAIIFRASYRRDQRKHSLTQK